MLNLSNKQLLAEFINFLKIPSISNNIKQVNKAIDWVADKFNTQFVDIHYFVSNNKKSLLIVPKGQDISQLDIILNGHVDVVDAPKKQFIPEIKQNKIYARGAYDMKSGVFGGILTMQEILKNPKNFLKVGLQIVPDEETGGFDGTLYQLKKGVKANFVVALEPTDYNIAPKAKGVYWFEVTAFGKSAHAAYPWKGKNAIEILNQFINNLEKEFPNPKQEKWVTTYNLSQITTPNTTMNKIPNQATLKVDMRYIPEDKQRIINFLKTREKILNIKIKDIMLEPAVGTSEQNEYVQKLSEVLNRCGIESKIIKRNGSSDVRHFARFNIPGIEFGPKGANAHSKDEYVYWPSILKIKDILVKWLAR